MEDCRALNQARARTQRREAKEEIVRVWTRIKFDLLSAYEPMERMDIFSCIVDFCGSGVWRYLDSRTSAEVEAFAAEIFPHIRYSL